MFDKEENDFYEREKESESKYHSVKVKIRKIFFLLVILGIVSGSVFTAVRNFGNTKKLEKYKFAYEQDGELYLLDLSSYEYVIDRFSKNPHLYINTFDFDGESYKQCFASDFLSFVYGDFKISKSDNPYFDREIRLNSQKYCTQETVYKNAKDSYEKSIFFDNNGKEIYTYDPVGKNDYIKNITFSGSRSSSKFSLRMLAMTERHVDLTELLEKQGIKFNLKIDNENMIIVISLDNSNNEKPVTDTKENINPEIKKEIEVLPEKPVEPQKPEAETGVQETKPEKTESEVTPRGQSGEVEKRKRTRRIY